MNLPLIDVVPEARRRRDEELAPAGWLRRFTASPPRLIEIRELYESLGHEVLLDPLTPGELAAECEGCMLALSVFRVVYTRTAATGAGELVPGADTGRAG